MNSKKKAIIFASFVSFFSLYSYGEEVATLSLDDCLRIALSENPTVKVADMEVIRQDYSKKETLASLLPQASFVGTYNRTLAKQVMYMNMDLGGFMPGGGAGAGDASGDESSSETSASKAGSRASGNSGGNKNGIKVGLDNSYQVGFSGSLPLIAPQLWAALKLSDSQILQKVEEARASKLNLVNNVKNAYYAIMLTEDSKKVIQESYDMAALTHEIYKKQFEAVTASDYDVLRTSVAMKNIEPQLLQADIAIKQARLQLMILLGLDTNFQFAVTGQLQDYENTMYAETLAINPDYKDNTQLRLNDIMTKQLDQALSVQKASLLPTLAASANYMWTSMSNGSPLKNFRWTPYSTIGLSLNLPILTGGSRYTKIKQAQIQIEEMKWQRENLERSISMQVDLAVDNIKANVEKIASSSQSVMQATRAHDIMEQSFAIGATSYLELRDSELALTQSRLAYYQAIYNYLVAQSDLELLLGNAKIEY